MKEIGGYDILLSFIQRTKDGDFTSTPIESLENARIDLSRDEYVFENDCPYYFSISSEL